MQPLGGNGSGAAIGRQKIRGAEHVRGPLNPFLVRFIAFKSAVNFSGRTLR